MDGFAEISVSGFALQFDDQLRSPLDVDQRFFENYNLNQQAAHD